MMRSTASTTRAAAVTASLALWAVAISAQPLSRLPGGLALPRSADSPGQVTFLHETHVDTDKPSCTTCHPRLFSILKQGENAKRVPMTHAEMEQGRQCGACHNGKQASALEDDCTHCHRE